MIVFVLLIVCVACGASVEASTSLRDESRKPKRSLKEMDSRVIGGIDVQTNRYEFFTLMWDKALCGGSLIAPDIVVTAAHCRNASTFAHVGKYTRREWEDESEFIEIEKIVTHPLYGTDGFSYDICLLKLKSPSTKPTIKLEPNPLEDHLNISTFVTSEDTASNQTSISPETLTLLGFGDVIPGTVSVIPTFLQEASLDYVPWDDCRSKYGNTQGSINSDMICAAMSGKSVCDGDSGSPLIQKGETISEDRLVGIASWGNKDCSSGVHPGVYASISFFYEWIVDSSCQLSPGMVPDYFDCDSESSDGSESPSTISSTAPSFALSAVPSFVPSIKPNVTSSPSSSPSAIDSLLPTEETSANDDNDAAGGTSALGSNPALLLDGCEDNCDTDGGFVPGTKCMAVVVNFLLFFLLLNPPT